MIRHNIEKHRFETTIDHHLAYVEYEIKGEYIDIVHTIVPKEIGGRGIAAELVKSTYEYGEGLNLKPQSTCSYAQVWLQRNKR